MHLSLAEGNFSRLSAALLPDQFKLSDAVLRISRASLHAPTREIMCADVCRATVENGGFLLAWIGWHDAERNMLVPAAQFGDDGHYLDSLSIYTDQGPEAHGPAGVAFRSGMPYVCNDFFADPATGPWRSEAARVGIRASATFPIRLQDATAGVFTVYAAHTGQFQAPELAILQAATLDVTAALDRFALNDQRRRAEEATSRMAEIIESMSDAVIGNTITGVITTWNPAAAEMFGYTAAEAVGNHVTMLMPSDRLGEEPDLLARIAKGERISGFETIRVRKNGLKFPASITISPIRSGHGRIVGASKVVRDISARKEAEEALRHSERRLQHAQRMAKICSWDYDVGSGMVSWSDDCSEIFGRDMREHGRAMPDMHAQIHPADREPVAAAQRATAAGGPPFNLQFRVVRPDGTLKWVHAMGELTRDSHGDPLGISGAFLDITRQRESELALRDANVFLEKRVRERTQELAEAKDLAESADRLKSAFLAAMSHELRTPLNSIIGFTGIVLKELAGPLTAEQSKQLGMVRGSARQLLSLINDVLNIAKIEAGQLEIHAMPFDLTAAITRLLDSMQPMAQQKSLELRINMQGALGTLISDQRRVEQVLLNLLNNAVKFTERGHIELSVECLEGHKLADHITPQPCVRFRVTDTGIGIKEADLKTLFLPFRQLDTGLTRQHEGTGLGLAICRRLAALLGGEIQVQSHFGSGSTFIFTIPRFIVAGAP